MEYAEASSEATFKVGFSDANTGFFNLDIACDEDQVDLFFEEMKKYLKISGVKIIKNTKITDINIKNGIIVHAISTL